MGVVDYVLLLELCSMAFSNKCGKMVETFSEPYIIGYSKHKSHRSNL